MFINTYGGQNMTTNNSKVKEIKGIKVSLNKRSASSWITYHRFTDIYGRLMPQQSKTFGKKSGVKNIDDAFSQAYNWIIIQQQRINTGFIADGNETTLGDYIENEWNPSRPKTATYDRYYSQLNMPAFNKIKRMRLTAINLKAVKELFNEIAQTPSKRNKKLPSSGSLDNYKKALSNVFRSAIQNNVIDHNPTLGLEIKRLVGSKQLIKESSNRLENRNAFSKEDVRTILEHLKKVDFQMYAIVKIMCLTGLRTQEVVALDMNHSINLKDNYFIIDQASTFKAGIGSTLKDTKTRVARRVYFYDTVADVIKEQMDRKMAELKSLMSKHEIESQEQLFLFSSHREHPNRLYQNQWISRRFTKLIENLDVKHYQLYSCRHTYANLQLESGTPAEVVAKQMGHSVQTFYNYYVHELDQPKRDAGKKNLLDEDTE